jgi:hypothetical protein
MGNSQLMRRQQSKKVRYGLFVGKLEHVAYHATGRVEEAHAHLREVLGLLSDKSPIYPIPRGTGVPSFSIPP